VANGSHAAAIGFGSLLVKRILGRFGCPHGRQKATQTVLEQAKVLCLNWAMAW